MRKRLHASLASIAILAWLLFILACTGWPSWNPDGRRVLVPFVDPANNEVGVAVYDVKARAAEIIYRDAGESSGEHLVFSQWQRDGKRALVFSLVKDPESKQHLVLLALPAGGSGAALQVILPDPGDSLSFVPFPEIAGNLYFAAAKYIARVDLRTGTADIKQFEQEESVYLSTDGVRVLYLRGSGEDVNATVEFGSLNIKDLTLEPTTRFTKGQVHLDGGELSDLYGWTAFDPHSSRIAMIGDTGHTDAIVLCTLQGVERTFSPAVPVADAHFGNLQWSSDGLTLYASVIAPPDENGAVAYFVGEIPLGGGAVRLTRIATLAREAYTESGNRLLLQVSLSPDGETIATSTAGLSKDKVAAADRALYLVRISDPARTVTKLPMPKGAAQ